jgi:hypothetical protein
MKTFENLPLSTFVRFGLTGIISVVLYLIVPLAVFNPNALKSLTDIDGVIGIVVGGFTFGFIIDGMKLYQLSPRYSRRKTEFMRRIAEALNVKIEAASVYFVKAAQLEREYGMGQIDFVHSRWVMFDACSKLFFFASFIWGGIGIVVHRYGFPQEAVSLGIISGTCLIISLRWFATSKQEQSRSESLYVDFCQRHKHIITGSDLEVKKLPKDHFI